MRAGDIIVLQTQTRARSLSKPNPAAAPAARARSPLALLLASLAGRARWWRSRRLKRAVRGRGAASAASWRAGEKLGGRWVVVVSGRLPRARRARARARARALLSPGLCLPCARPPPPPPPRTPPCPPWPLPGVPRLWPHGGLHNIPSQHSLPSPPPKGRQERALALSDALAPPLILSPPLSTTSSSSPITHRRPRPDARRYARLPLFSLVNYGAGPLPSEPPPPPPPPLPSPKIPPCFSLFLLAFTLCFSSFLSFLSSWGHGRGELLHKGARLDECARTCGECERRVIFG